MTILAIVGCGYWGPNYVRIFNELAPGSVKTVCDIDKSRLLPIKSVYPHLKITSSYKEILTDNQIEAICISTPASTHYDMVKQGLSHGKHVLVEKPLTLNSKEAEDLVTIARNKRLILMVGHVYLYHPAVIKIKEYLNKGELGDVFYLHAMRTGLGPIRKDANAMWDLAPHDISIFVHLLGSLPTTVTAKGASFLQKGIEDVVSLSMEFPGKTIGYVHTSWLDPYKLRRLTVVGKEKMVLFEDASTSEKLKIFDQGVIKKEANTYGEFLLQIRSGDVHIPKIDSTEPLKNECLGFLLAVENHTEPVSNGNSAISVVKILEAAQESLVNGGLPVNVTTHNIESITK